MYLRIARALLLFLAMSGSSAAGVGLHDLPDKTLSDLMGRAGLRSAWRVEQYWFRNEWRVYAYAAPRQSTSDFCSTERTSLFIRQRENQKLDIYRVEKNLVVLRGFCADNYTEQEFDAGTVPGHLTEVELIKFIHMITSLINTGAIGKSGISVAFNCPGTSVPSDCADARQATRKLKLEELFSIDASHPDLVAFNFAVKMPGRMPRAEALVFDFPRLQEKNATVKISLEDVIDVAR